MAHGLQRSDYLTLGILAAVVVALTFRLPEMLGAWALHAGLLAAFALVVLKTGYRVVPTIVVMFALYTTLATVPFEAFSWRGDAALAAADEWLFLGTSPVLAIEPYVTRGVLEFFSLIYGWYIPYLYLSLFLGLVGRPEHERRRFLTGFTATYVADFLGYLFVPAHGPILFLAEEFTAPLQGGTFHGVVTRSVDSLGGPHGAFPSLHMAITTYLCLFDLRHDRLRGLTYVPIAVLIAVATLVTRYHYVVDLVAGVLIAFWADRYARRSC